MNNWLPQLSMAAPKRAFLTVFGILPELGLSFSALPVYSSHKLFHPQGAAAIASFLTRERRATIRALNAYRKASPNKDEPEYLPEFAGE